MNGPTDTRTCSRQAPAPRSPGAGDNWYTMYPDYAFGQDMQKKFETAIEGAGGKVVAKDPHRFPRRDNYSTFLLKAAGLKPKPQVLGALQAGVTWPTSSSSTSSSN